MCRVLIVDDEPLVLHTWRRGFGKLGKLVDAACTRAEATAFARAHAPDVAIVDVRLGTESGFDVLTDLKSIAPHIFVVLVSSYMNVTWAMEAIRAGADFCFIKPISCGQVVTLVEQGDLPEPDWNDPGMGLDEFEWEFISRVLVDCANNISRSAKHMKLHVTTLRRKLEKRGVLPLAAMPAQPAGAGDPSCLEGDSPASFKRRFD